MIDNLTSRLSEVTTQNQPHWCSRCGGNYTAQYKRSGRCTSIALYCKPCMAIKPAWRLDKMGRTIMARDRTMRPERGEEGE